ncbi:TetR family transcriptional regulator [Streptomyces sp. NPDC059445]|uniref:TetR family transcriptional regulator n=1 Tax=Streptomyces sp. NPDC059445 TaxID=3346832 RepID=UPI003690F28D
MVRQLRAEQTRHALIAAAAAEFDRHGYAGTSLSRICKSAGTTMGALTFHFPTKGDLAEAVRAAGDAATLTALRPIAAVPRPGVQVVIDLTIELAWLLERDVTVRAAGRLVQEGTGDPAQRPAGWVRVLRELLERARAEADGIPVPCDRDLRDMELLVAYLMAGAEASVRSGAEGGSVSQELRSLWSFLTCGGLHDALTGKLVGDDALMGDDTLAGDDVSTGVTGVTGDSGFTRDSGFVGEPGYARESGFAEEPHYAREPGFTGGPGFADATEGSTLGDGLLAPDVSSAGDSEGAR